MGLRSEDQNKIYNEYWKDIELCSKEESTNINRLSDFIRDFLTIENKKISVKNRVYEDFKEKYPTSSVSNLELVLKELKQLAKHYNKIINPQNEQDKDIQRQLRYIDKLEVNVAHPFIMKVYDDYSKSVIDKQTFINILELIQSFVWRRFVVGLPTNALNKIFMTLYDTDKSDGYLYSIQKSLMRKKGSQRFPLNTEVKDALKVKDVYNIKSKNRIYLWERLENYNNQEKVVIDGNQQITIEHIFPQTPDIKWKKELGEEEFKYIKENYLNTVGNLTLSGNNGALGNKIFSEKRDLPEKGYRDSRLWLNKSLVDIDRWDISAIEERYNLIVNRFFKIWNMPNIVINDDVDRNEEVNIFEADTPKGKKLEYAFFFDQKIQVSQVSKLYIEVIKRLYYLEPEVFFTTGLGDRLGLTKISSSENLRQPIEISSSYAIEGNIDNVGKFDRIKDALTTFGYEDELTIKYAEV